MNIGGLSTNGHVLALSGFLVLQSSCKDGSGKRPWLESSKKRGNGNPARFGDCSHSAKSVLAPLLIGPNGGS